MRPVWLWWCGWLCGLALAGASAAEIFRCEALDGSIRYTSTASACETALPQNLRPLLPPAEEPTGAPAAAAEAGGAPTFEEAFPPASALGGWEITHETPDTTVADFASLGVQASEVRHYGRSKGGITELCSLELWRFGRPAQAQAAVGRLEFPDWEFESRGHMLVLTHAVTLVRGGRGSRGIFPACRQLTALALRRISAAGP